MVLPERIELSASPLPRECSTTELRQHGARKAGACYEPGRANVKRTGGAARVATKKEEREARLARALRENLKRRKAAAQGGKTEEQTPKED